MPLRGEKKVRTDYSGPFLNRSRPVDHFLDLRCDRDIDSQARSMLCLAGLDSDVAKYLVVYLRRAGGQSQFTFAENSGCRKFRSGQGPELCNEQS